MKKLTLVFSLVAAVCMASAINAQEAKKALPKFKQDAVSLWLSPSNQINNEGYGDYGTEKERMNAVADVVEPILKAQGVKVYRNDPKETIRDYTAHANELNVDLYFAIHSNAYKGESRGTEAFCHQFGGESEKFARRINDAIMSIYPGPNRGVKESYKMYDGQPMWETGKSNMPACLVEIAFHDNEIDSKWIIDNTQKIGELLAQAVLEHLAEFHPDALETEQAAEQKTDAQDEALPKFKQDALSMWLSPSNQINNKGYGDYGTEKERMNAVADVVEPILKAQGLKVYRNDPKKSIHEYTDEANELNVDLYFAIHSNAANKQVRGTEVWCNRKGGEAERFAKRINDEIMAIYDGPNRGVKEGYNRFGDRPMWEPYAPKAASCLVEIAFHDEEQDATWIMDNTDKIGAALAKAVLKHLAAEHPEALEQ